MQGGDPVQPSRASKTEEQDAAGGEATASAARGELGKVSHHFCVPPSGFGALFGPVAYRRTPPVI